MNIQIEKSLDTKVNSVIDNFLLQDCIIRREIQLQSYQVDLLTGGNGSLLSWDY